jgi:hypothetical protein
MGGPIALIDTERRSASKYGDRFEFDVVDLEDRNVKNYTLAIRAAASAQYPILIVDSLTHAWHTLVGEVEAIAKAKYSGNTWSAWSEGTPMQREFVDALLKYPGHIIATMRTKTEWTVEKDNKSGRSKPVRVGLAPEQGKGIEYEFDLLAELTVDHIANIIKDRTGKYQDRIIKLIDEDLGKELIEWLNEGAEAKDTPSMIDSKLAGRLNAVRADALADPASITRTLFFRVADTLIKGETDIANAIISETDTYADAVIGLIDGYSGLTFEKEEPEEEEETAEEEPEPEPLPEGETKKGKATLKPAKGVSEPLVEVELVEQMELSDE